MDEHCDTNIENAIQQNRENAKQTNTLLIRKYPETSKKLSEITKGEVKCRKKSETM